MALNFPNSPTDGQIYTDGNTGIRFVFNSTYGVWRANGTSAVIGTAGNNQILINQGGLVRGSHGLVFSNTSNSLFIDAANVTNGVTTNTISFGTNSSKDKIRLYDSEIPYAIGMANRMTFGPLRDDWAMTFQMNDDIDRGFWWGDVVHSNDQGAMALTTDGNLYVASKIRLGFGETDSADQETWIYNLDVKGNVNSSAFLINGTPVGAFLIDDTVSATRYLVFANNNSGTFLQANTDTGLTYNPSNNRLNILGGTANATQFYVNEVVVTSISNAFTSATVAGANTAVGTTANNYASTILQANVAAANGWANSIGVVANNYATTILTANVAAANGWANAVAVVANTYARTILTANIAAANGWANTVVLTANTIANAAFNKANSALANANATFAGTLTLLGTVGGPGAIFYGSAENVNVSATAATGNTNYYVSNQSILYFTSTATARFNANVSWSSTTPLNNILDVGESTTIVWMVTQGATAYHSNGIFIDGSSVVPKWQGGTDPKVGNASSVDIYTYNIVKTGAGAFTVFASQTQFK